ncbi:uncharacterized protein [Miscanthus floridulus]|uniref:uncharacterized protein n=1 Tax=Miscanthus floridulus TaxID=154761 RepID=UPI003458C680
MACQGLGARVTGAELGAIVNGAEIPAFNPACTSSPSKVINLIQTYNFYIKNIFFYVTSKNYDFGKVESYHVHKSGGTSFPRRERLNPNPTSEKITVKFCWRPVKTLRAATPSDSRDLRTRADQSAPPLPQPPQLPPSTRRAATPSACPRVEQAAAAPSIPTPRRHSLRPPQLAPTWAPHGSPSARAARISLPTRCTDLPLHAILRWDLRSQPDSSVGEDLDFCKADLRGIKKAGICSSTFVLLCKQILKSVAFHTGMPATAVPPPLPPPPQPPIYAVLRTPNPSQDNAGTFGSSVGVETPDETISRIACGVFRGHPNGTTSGGVNATSPVNGTTSGGVNATSPVNWWRHVLSSCRGRSISVLLIVVKP